MRRIVLGKWKSGFNKVAMNHLLRDYTPLGLAGAKGLVDRMLEGQGVALELDDETADDFIEAAKQLGADVQVMDHVV